MSRAAWAWVLTIASSLVLVPGAAAEPTAYVFPLRVHLGPRAEANRGWMVAQVQHANDYFGPYQVRFLWRDTVRLPASMRTIHHAAGRRSFDLDEHAIDVFVPDEIVGDEGSHRSVLGVTDPRRQRGAHRICLEAEEPDDVLAHELGHYFGLEHHIDAHNLMYAHSMPGTHEITDLQGAQVLRRAAGFALSGRPAPLQAP